MRQLPSSVVSHRKFVVNACEKCFLLKKECSFSLYSQSTHMEIWCVVKACIHRTCVFWRIWIWESCYNWFWHKLVH